MKLFWRLAKEAAYARHAILVTALHWHDRDMWAKEMTRHYKLVDDAYAVVIPKRNHAG